MAPASRAEFQLCLGAGYRQQHQLLGSLLLDSNDSSPLEKWRNLIDRATVESLKRLLHRFASLRL
jgi:hypothetical protein